MSWESLSERRRSMPQRWFKSGDRVQITDHESASDHVAPDHMGRFGTVVRNQLSELSPVGIRLDDDTREMRPFRASDLKMIKQAFQG